MPLESSDQKKKKKPRNSGVRKARAYKGGRKRERRDQKGFIVENGS